MATDQHTAVDDATTPGNVTERIIPGDYDDEPPSGLQGPFFQKVGKRKNQGRDAKVLVTAKDGATGVGKSNVCDFLGHALDTTEEGFAPFKITIEPMRFIEMYGELPKGSALVMEEAEQFDSRRSQRNENVAASQKWQQARVREVVALLNLPDPSTIDQRFEMLADFWINVERRGKARIYEKKIHSIKQKIYYKTLQTLEWPNMDGSETTRAMSKLKTGLLDGEMEENGLIRESEAQKQLEAAVKEAKRNTRNAWIQALKSNHCPNCAHQWTGKEIARLPPVEVTPQRINQIARRD
jgi:hypothetical protein